MTDDLERFPILIAGFGNEIMGDDGVGVHAARALAADPPPEAVIAEVGTALLDALHLLEAADLVVALDAVDVGAAPGTIVQFEGLPPPPCKISSLHEVDLAAALRMLPGDRRPRVIVLGVQPLAVETGLELTPIVAEALPRLVEAARAIAAAVATGSCAGARPTGDAALRPGACCHRPTAGRVC
jgi:hydrogenase maturation protease